MTTRKFFLEKSLIMSPCSYSPLASDWSPLLCPDWSTVQHPDWSTVQNPDWHYPDRCIQLVMVVVSIKFVYLFKYAISYGCCLLMILLHWKEDQIKKAYLWYIFLLTTNYEVNIIKLIITY